MIQPSKTASAAGLLLLAAASGASAQAAGPGAVDWSGLYGGGQLGWGWTGGDGTIEVDGAGYDTDIDGNGPNVGLTVGYRWDLGNYILGGEAQFDWSWTDFDEVTVDGDDVDPGRLKDMWRVKGVAGIESGRMLYYGSVGWARASIRTDNDTFDGEGWVVGAGADYLVTDRLAVGGEINYHMFDDINAGIESFDLNVTRLQAKATFRF